jgi:hypothetical protein
MHGFYTATSRAENSAQVSSCHIKYVHAYTLKISLSFFKVDCIFQVKDCQTGEDGETPILSFENGLQLEAGLLVSFLQCWTATVAQLHLRSDHNSEGLNLGILAFGEKTYFTKY